jgi:predicted ATPase/signal transduction histidine kinase/tRNA A-37 threonylcarbamoyl transferase component Bud32
MTELPGRSALASYTIIETLSQRRSTVVHRAWRDSDGRLVVLKVLDPRRSRPKDLERLKREYEIGRLLDTRAVVRPLALETYQGMPALVLEDFGARSLDRLLGAPMPMDRFLPIAIGIAGAIAEVHERRVTHRDLKPHNILVSLAGDEVKIADFGLASRLPGERDPAQPVRLIEGSLPYLAPEQTGRTDRAIDSRADLYSLGVTFHQMLTGRLPFEAQDPVEWVHHHLACTPPKVSEIVPEVPEAITRIVLKLLSKAPEGRYQSARGLRRDLEKCLEAWRRSGAIEPFRPGEHDVPDRLQIPQRLYGREAEIALLQEALGRVVITGTPELVLVSGYSGIGKSVLVHELEAPVVRERGCFISGKFDQYQRDVPYATLVQAVRELVLSILAESEEHVAARRQLLLDALGVNAQLIVEVIPEVALVIGRHPPPPELPPVEAQNRLRMVLRSFIGVIARAEHPLALFLDDLQWADSASLGLLRELLTHADVRHVLVIGAYRDHEVTPSHPLALTLDQVREAGTRISAITVGSIPCDPFAALVADTLRCSRAEAEPVADLVRDKTAGNPFFAIQFLTALHAEGLIAFDGSAGALRWDVARIRARDSTDNVVDLVVGKLQRLPAATLVALERFACLGSGAEVALLSAACGGSREETHAVLWGAVDAGLVLRVGESYRFVHDRVQEAAYVLIPAGERPAVHLDIGRRLWASTALEDREARVFTIVNQIDRGAALIAAPEERERAAEMNLVAGRRAFRATAYSSALTYFVAGTALLGDDPWGHRHALAFALDLGRAECEYLTGELAAAESRLAMLAERAVDVADAAVVACARVSLYTTQDRSDLAVRTCLDYLERTGLALSPHPTDEEVERVFERVWRKLGGRPIEELTDLPPARDPATRAAMDVIMSCHPASLHTDANLSAILAGHLVDLSLEHGNGDASCFAYVWLGTLMGSRFGDYRAGFRFGKLGCDLVEKRGLLRFRVRASQTFGLLISAWAEHVRSSLERERRAFAAAQETGDLTFACYACHGIVTFLLAAGEPLVDVQREAEAALHFAERSRYGLVADVATGQLRLVKALLGLTKDLASFGDAHFDEARFEAHFESREGLALPACLYWIRKLEARSYAGDHAGALEAAAKARRLLWATPSFPELADYHLHAALAHAARCDGAPARERGEHLQALAAHRRQLELWAVSCPENFGHRAVLVGAEVARVEGRGLDAERLYEEAARLACRSGFVHGEALAFEAAARFYRGRGLDRIADTYLRDARAAYARWGAEGKLKQIERDHPYLVEQCALGAAATVAVRSEQIDLYAVTKASQTISGEIVVDKLARTLLRVALEQGGAQRACLVLCRGGGLSVEAEVALEGPPAVASTSGGVAADASLGGVGRGPAPPGGDPSWTGVPTSLLQYARRTRERVILGDAAGDAGKFSADPYFARPGTSLPKSVLCLPIVRQAEVVGLLYLENGLLAGAFTRDRLTALELLATQAAISLENALLLAKEQAARAEAEAAEQRSAFVAEAGVLLSESLDYEETFARLGQLCVRSLADFCVIDIVEGDEIKRLAWAHAEPDKAPLLAELGGRYPPRWDSPHPATTVLRTGKPLLLSDLTDETLRATCVDEEHLRILRALGAQTAISVPLAARGQTLGAITLTSATRGRRYGRADLELSQEVARRAALAIDNARLYRAKQEAIGARNEFLTVASHELHTPMTSLRLAVQSLRRAAPSGRPRDPEAMDRMLELVLRQSVRLTRLTNDLLDVSRIEAGRLRLERTQVELSELVREVVTRLEMDLAWSKCSVSMGSSPLIVGCWDRSRLDQVVTNLLSNAIKFGAGKPIEIALGAESGVARLVIRDQGIGVDPDRVGQIFERFERAVSDRQYGGLGLGLYISRAIVEEHGGSIRCESRWGAGATFIIELPAVTPPILGR